MPDPTGDHDGRVSLQPTEGQSQGNSQSESGKPAVLAKQEQQRATIPDVVAASFAIRVQYRGMDRMHELPLTAHTIGQLALEAALREMTIGDLIADIITAMVEKDLFQRVLDDIDPGRSVRSEAGRWDSSS